VQKGVHWLGRKIGDNKVGNWLQRFQEGGEVNSQINLEQVVAALQEDPEGTIDQLLQLGEQGQQILEALSQDPNIGQMIASILQQKGMAPAQQKNGGAIKKADCGCKATLKRMGGRIVNVDCTGKIVK